MITAEDGLRVLCNLHWRSKPAARVVSGFPGVGKTELCLRNPSRVSDSDSSQFVKGEGFAEEYIRHIRWRLEFPDIALVLVSSHDIVRAALTENGIPFVLAYPEIDLKDEYIHRYWRRGSTPQFIEMMERNWSRFVSECENQSGCQHLRLKAGQFLNDVISVV